MVKYLGINAVAALLRRMGTEAFLVELARYIEQDFQRWPLFEKSARLASHSRQGVIELMPTSDGHLYAFKYVNGHPANTASGLLTVTALGVLADVETGYPLLLSEMTLTTALRTAATSALAARWLARKGSRSMALIGLGAQAEFQALAFKAILGITELQVFDPDARAVEKFTRNLAHAGFAIGQARSVIEAVRGVDIVTTATAAKSHVAVLTADMIGPGMHINAIGGDCPGKTELSPDVLRKSRVFVEFMPQSRIEGEIQQLDADYPAVELWKVLTRQEQGRRSEAEITVFDSVGFAVEDFSTLCLLKDLSADDKTPAQDLDLVPHLSDPKNLFGLLESVRGLRSAPAALETGTPN